MHKRILDPVLASLDAERSAYFGDIANTLGNDARIEKYANLVFLFLATAAPFLPTHLPKRAFIELLIKFVSLNARRIAATVYQPGFVYDRDMLKPVVTEFVMEAVSTVLHQLDEGTIDEDGGNTTYHLSWPIDPEAFPYADADDEDD